MQTLLKALGGLGVIGIVIAVLIAVVLWPLAIVWALNTLFGLTIAYTFWTWLAALVLVSAITSSTSKKE